MVILIEKYLNTYIGTYAWRNTSMCVYFSVQIYHVANSTKVSQPKGGKLDIRQSNKIFSKQRLWVYLWGRPQYILYSSFKFMRGIS